MRISDWSSDVCSSDLSRNWTSRPSRCACSAPIRWRECGGRSAAAPSEKAGGREALDDVQRRQDACDDKAEDIESRKIGAQNGGAADQRHDQDRKSTRLNSSH